VEPDPLPWLILALALLLVGLATTLEVIFTAIGRSEVRRKVEQGDPFAHRLDELFGSLPHLFIAFSLLKYTGLLLIGAVSAWIALQTQSAQAILVVFCGWFSLALLQPLWRRFTIRRATALIVQLAPVVSVLQFLLRPLVLLIHQVTTWTNQSEQLRVEDGNGLADETLRMWMNTTEGAEEIEENEREMIVSILEMNDTVAREVMVPRIDIVAIETETSFQEALDTVIAAGHSRIPVYEEHIDHILGILYAKDMLRCFRDQAIDVPIRELLRPAYFIPASKKVDVLFQEMQKHRVHIAMVVDEYGGTAGLVTIEDILEEIVGDIQDEYDIEEDTYVQNIAPDIYLLNSRLDVYSLSKLLDIELDNDSADTLGGFLFSLMEHVPEQGECIEHQGWRFTVLLLDGRRIEQVRAERIQVHSQGEAPARTNVTHDCTSSSDSLIKIQAMD